MKQCNWCGAELEDDARACNNCGRPVPDMPETRTPEKTVSEKQDGMNTADLQKQQAQEDPWNRQDRNRTEDPQNPQDPWNRQNQQDPWSRQNQQDPWNQQNQQDPWSQQNQQNPWNQQNQQSPWNQRDPWNPQGTQDPWGQNTDPQQPYGGWQPQVPPNGQPDYNGYNRQQIPVYAPQQAGLRKYNTYAVWALVCGGLASFLNGLVFVPSILAIVFGIVALVQTRRNAQLYKGSWMAVAGLLFGIFFLIVYGYVFHMIFQAVQNPETLEQLQQYLKEISNTR